MFWAPRKAIANWPRRRWQISIRRTSARTTALPGSQPASPRWKPYWLWSQRAEATALDQTVTQLAFAETIAQLTGGLPMGQNELFRPADLGLSDAARDLADACADLVEGDLAPQRAAVAAALAQGHWPSESLDDAGTRYDPRPVPPVHRSRNPAARAPVAPRQRADPRCHRGRRWPRWAPLARPFPRNLAG